MKECAPTREWNAADEAWRRGSVRSTLTLRPASGGLSYGELREGHLRLYMGKSSGLDCCDFMERRTRIVKNRKERHEVEVEYVVVPQKRGLNFPSYA